MEWNLNAMTDIQEHTVTLTSARLVGSVRLCISDWLRLPQSKTMQSHCFHTWTTLPPQQSSCCWLKSIHEGERDETGIDLKSRKEEEKERGRKQKRLPQKSNCSQVFSLSPAFWHQYRPQRLSLFLPHWSRIFIQAAQNIQYTVTHYAF